ncbi:MAG: hypothetical protein ACO3JL_08675 [Myxococcota bacterium]
MALKAQKRSISTTRPRRNAAHIAQERTKPSGRRQSPPRQSGGKSAGRATRVRQREANPKVRKGRFFLLIAFMAALGFTTVYLGDAALRTFAHLDSGSHGASLWHKVVDRLLDRDIPGLKPTAPPSKPQTPTRKPAVPKPRAPLAERAQPAPAKVQAPAAALERLPKVTVPETPRAELAAPPPSAYAEATGGTSARRGQDAAAARAQRMRALLDKVGVER